MKIKPVLAFIAIAVIVSQACSSTAPGKSGPTLHGDECVFFRTLYDWQRLDDSNIVIWAPGRHDAYHVSLSMPLVGLNFATSLTFIDADGDGRLCGFGFDAVAVSDSAVPQRSTFRSMRYLNPEDFAKLEDQYKIKLTRDPKKKIPKEPERETAK